MNIIEKVKNVKDELNTIFYDDSVLYVTDCGFRIVGKNNDYCFSSYRIKKLIDICFRFNLTFSFHYRRKPCLMVWMKEVK